MEAARDVPAFSRLVGNARQSVGAPAEVQRAERRTRQCMFVMLDDLQAWQVKPFSRSGQQLTDASPITVGKLWKRQRLSTASRTVSCGGF